MDQGRSRTDANSEDNLSEWEADALKRMEAKFSVSPEEESPFKHLRLIHKDVLRGSHFLAYENDATEPAIKIYSEKNRFRYLLSMLTDNWAADLQDFLQLTLLAVQDKMDSFQEEELDTFGLKVSDDSFIVGYRSGAISPIVATKDLLIRILDFYVKSLERLGRSEYSVDVSECRRLVDQLRSIEEERSSGEP